MIYIDKDEDREGVHARTLHDSYRKEQLESVEKK